MQHVSFQITTQAQVFAIE